MKEILYFDQNFKSYKYFITGQYDDPEPDQPKTAHASSSRSWNASALSKVDEENKFFVQPGH